MGSNKMTVVLVLTVVLTAALALISPGIALADTPETAAQEAKEEFMQARVVRITSEGETAIAGGRQLYQNL